MRTHDCAQDMGPKSSAYGAVNICRPRTSISILSYGTDPEAFGIDTSWVC